MQELDGDDPQFVLGKLPIFLPQDPRAEADLVHLQSQAHGLCPDDPVLGPPPAQTGPFPQEAKVCLLPGLPVRSSESHPRSKFSMKRYSLRAQAHRSAATVFVPCSCRRRPSWSPIPRLRLGL